jgi:uncharacterized protein YcbX
LDSQDAVGSVSRLWRYPVKSMIGEEIESAEVVWSGFHGNRCYALVDVESSRVVSAKNPAKWARMFQCSSRLLQGREHVPIVISSAPPAQVTLPDGRRFDIADGMYGGAEQALSELLGRQVRFAAARAEPRAFTIEQYHPGIEEDREAGRTTEYFRSAEAQAGTFTDTAAVHLVTTATLKEMSELYPRGDFDPLRFRPNLLVDTDAANGFVESLWVGRTLAVGDEVRLKVFKECGRCVMTTLPQGRLVSDVGILSTIKRFNRGKIGVLASVLKGGKIKKGDRIAFV